MSLYLLCEGFGKFNSRGIQAVTASQSGAMFQEGGHHMEECKLEYDVVVCGGGLPGVCAAVAAARGGVRVALAHERPVLGGNSSSEAGVPPHGATAMGHNRMARETGIVEELRMEYAARSPHADNRHFWDLVLRDWCAREPLLDLYLHTKVISASMSGDTIESVQALQSTTETIFRFQAKVFVDATGDGFLAAEAGAKFRLGREGKSEFSENLAPDIADSKTLGSTLYFVTYRRDYPVQFSPPSWAKKYHDCSAFPYRPHNIDAITPRNALSPDETACRLFWWLALGGNRDVIKDNEQIYGELLAELMGIWGHLKNHCNEKTRKALECYDLVWWSAFPLRRESRRVEGDYIMTEKDIVSPKLFFDRVAYGGWPIDLHPPAGVQSEEPPCDQMFLNDLYDVPYRCLYSRNVANLMLAGRCISASHVALGSLRVMSTLSMAAQAVGTAACLCIRHSTTPRGVLKDHIEELQQQLLRDDAYIIGLRNSDTHDIARSATVQTSSSASVLAESTEGYLELAYDIGQQIPVSSSRITRVEVFLKSALTDVTAVHLELHSSSKIGRLWEEKPLAEADLVVQPGEAGWLGTDLDVKLPEESLLWICLRKQLGVYWGYTGGYTSQEAFGTRFAVKYLGPHVPSWYEGNARIAPFDDQWFPINHHGRLPEEIQKWIEKQTGVIDQRMLRGTLNVRLDPVQKPYFGKNVINGAGRAEDWPNIWISDPSQELPQWLSLTWSEPKTIKEIALSFDTNLDMPERMFGFPRERFRFSFPVPQCANGYEIAIRVDDHWENIVRVSDNYHRRRIHELQEAIVTDGVRITVLKTNGAREARIYEVRIY